MTSNDNDSRAQLDEILWRLKVLEEAPPLGPLGGGDFKITGL